MTKVNVTELGKLTKEALEVKGIELDTKESKAAVETVFEVIRERLIAGDDIDIFNFGKIENKTRSARKGYNPKLLKELKEKGVPEVEAKKQAEIDIAEKRALGLKPLGELKKQLNN
ncbi:HU family DNA-binding protein [Lysinibacillus sp. Bpr_S20]|uniref:HU family DNA-binding protein n=1 Tax=Lysinibacillus sp. Bpr_S20 TaxID=2933964 RepID=UPI002010CE58|nr:HU family DNA-binding protein [Lysinibacillus sp. Bpr_S20]MCL1700829.1 HU family DNA-binding protein [Lysinibacillus sp. Bpr_S20]